jgi:Ser/Thr protein kinase RdoA (MazF antagonist)
MFSRLLTGWCMVPERSPKRSFLPPLADFLFAQHRNLHWRVQSGNEAFVLRMYKRPRTVASIQYELDILAHLRDRQWPVAAAVDGVVERLGRSFVLFPLLPGAPCQEENQQQSRRRGRILAKLQIELAGLVNCGQRDVWQRTDEVVQHERSCLGNCTLNVTHPELVQTIARRLDSVHDRLCATGASRFPVCINHGDFITQNLLFDREVLSGVLDFDSAHFDLRAADVACARRSRNDDVVRGYLDVIPLSDEELGCLDDLWRASVLRYGLQLFESETTSGKAVSELEWCLGADREDAAVPELEKVYCDPRPLAAGVDRRFHCLSD